jgi:hypothetical protein
MTNIPPGSLHASKQASTAACMLFFSLSSHGILLSFFQSTWPQGPPSALKKVITKQKSEVITKSKKHPTTLLIQLD